MTGPGGPHAPSAPTVLLDADEIAAHVARLAGEIARDHPNGVVLVGVLKGALLFLADLARLLPGPDVAVDVVAVSRYAPDTGRVRFLKDLDVDVAGRDVVLVEDLVDTGLTLAYLCRQLEARGPRRLEVCALLDRAARRIVPLDVRYRGVEIPDVYALGYGLHHADLYRNLPFVVAVDPRVLAADPAAYVPALYAGAAR